MILLEDENALIQATLTAKFAEPGPVDQTFTDFDDVHYYLESSKAGPVSLSMGIKCWKELEAAGAMDVLQREYGSYLLPQAKEGYSVSLEIDYATLPEDAGALPLAAE
jgi:actin related protein 2/3 complex subunit 2